MSGEALPAEVRQFIFRHLSSVEELEIITLLSSDSTREWNAEAIYQIIRSSRESVLRGLEKFAGAGLVEKYDESPASYSLTRETAGQGLVGDLVRAYREAPVRVIEAIYQKPRDSVQGFADAFKFKPDP